MPERWLSGCTSLTALNSTRGLRSFLCPVAPVQRRWMALFPRFRSATTFSYITVSLSRPRWSIRAVIVVTKQEPRRHLRSAGCLNPRTTDLDRRSWPRQLLPLSSARSLPSFAEFLNISVDAARDEHPVGRHPHLLLSLPPLSVELPGGLQPGAAYAQARARSPTLSTKSTASAVSFYV